MQHQKSKIGNPNSQIKNPPSKIEISENKQGVFRVYINPLVWWMWLSGPIIFFGAMFAISPMRIGWIKKKSRVVS